MAKTLDEAGVKRIIQEIKGANKNLNTPIPISTENTPESMAQNVKNIADYVEKAKAAGVANVDGMAVTCIIDGDYSAVGYLYREEDFVGVVLYDDNLLSYVSIINGSCNILDIITRGASNQVTSSMLDKGARNPIIITEDMTEVDEETYQKLLSDDVDVWLKIDQSVGKFCPLIYKFDSGSALKLYFTCFSIEGETIYDTYLNSYEMGITKTSPHTCSIFKNFNDTLDVFINNAGYLNEAYLNAILPEIDLTGTDADRKAKLDKFEIDWKDLTGASDLRGARFVGGVDNTDNSGTCSVLFTFDYSSNALYQGCAMASDTDKKIVRYTLYKNDGSLIITPLFSHLEAITIYTDNTPEHMQANLDNIAAYEANLQALGVDTTKGWNAPVSFSSGDSGILSYTVGYYYLGILFSNNNVTLPYSFGIRKSDGYFSRTYIFTQATVISSLTTTSKKIVDAINEVNANAVHSDKLVPTLEAITIKTDNSTASKAANVAAIKAYVDNLTALGVDVTKGYMIPCKFPNSVAGVLSAVSSSLIVAITTNGRGELNCYEVYIGGDNPGAVYSIGGFQLKISSNLTTTSKQIVGAINEVNALAKSKQDALTSGTNIKTVNGQSLLGSGDIAISGGGSAPVLVDIDDITGSAGVSVPVDVFNKIANAASAKTPIFGYSKLVNGTRTTYEIIPLYVKNVSTPDTNGSLSIQFIAANAYNSVGIMKRSDTECSILISSSLPFALDTSVDKSSTRGIQSSAVWKEIHSEPMTVNTATSGVTALSSTDNHKILCYADSGTQQYNLPSSPVDGETFLFLKVKSGHAITIQSGTGNQNIYDCSSGNSVVSKTIETSTKIKITVTYSSTVGKWLLMANDFIS